MSVLIDADQVTVQGPRGQCLLKPISFQLKTGRPLVILGETGSGKSLLVQAIMGVLPAELTATGTALVAGHQLNLQEPAAVQALWGREMAILPQEPALALDPVMRARGQIGETHRLVRGVSRSTAANAAISDLEELGLTQAAGAYPHELSGGMAQRLAVAVSRAGGAAILLADEPTKGLDASRRHELGEVLLTTTRQGGGLLVITHDLALAHQVGGDLIVLREAKVVERGPLANVMTCPQAPYTRQLLAADPSSWPRRVNTKRDQPPVIEVLDLAVARGGRLLLEGLDLDLTPGEILGVVGPSGCGKSSLGDTLLGLLPPSRGTLNRDQNQPHTAFQKLYQDPVAAFPRTRKLGLALADIEARHNVPAGRLSHLLDQLELDAGLLDRLPVQVSGGELQRLALARVMLLKPALIVADEPTSRLDPIVQRRVIKVLTELAKDEACALVLISHDHTLIDRVADRSLSLEAMRWQLGNALSTGIELPQALVVNS